MKLEAVLAPEMTTPGQIPESSKGWPFAAALILSAIFWLLAWYGETAQSIVAIWQRSETFAHGYLIAPISAWMIWRRRHDLARLVPQPQFLALPMLALAGFVWLLGHLSAAGIVQQYALVVMIPLLVWNVLGSEVVRALAFPLFFLLLAVPFGEFLLPLLMDHTADFTILAIRLSGIPVYREGLFFTLPSGNWSVVETCSGLRYLIASVTLGLLYAHLTYRSVVRRAVFIAFSVLVPIVANWLRAYMIVMIGHLTEMRYAVGVDHLIYGWVFFGIVMLILFWIGTFWREDDVPRDAAPGAGALPRRREPSLPAIMAAAIASAAMAAIWPVAASRLEGTGPYTVPMLQAPPAAGGWQPLAGRLTDWTPRFINPHALVEQAYGKEAKRVGLYIGYYRNQRDGAKLITSKNTLVHSTHPAWGNIGETHRTSIFNNEEVPLIESRLRGRSMSMLVWSWYWVDGRYVVNPYWAKLLQATSRLFGDGDDGAVVIVYTELGGDGKAAAGTLQDFLNAMLPGITTGLNHAR